MKPADMLTKQLKAEFDLAKALGWTNLVESGGTLLGTPPAGGENSRGQAAVPAWTRDWSACGKLLGASGADDTLTISREGTRFTVAFGTDSNRLVAVEIGDEGRDGALRYAIVCACIGSKVTDEDVLKVCLRCGGIHDSSGCYCEASPRENIWVENSGVDGGV